MTSHRTHGDGEEFDFTNVMTPWLAPLIALFLLVNLVWLRTAALWLLVLPLAILFLKNVWIFSSEEPRAEHQRKWLGFVLWRRSYALAGTDRATAELTEDGSRSIQRPRWYRLRLALASRLRDPVVVLGAR